MALTEALRIVLQADAAGAVKGIEQVGRTADRELSRSEKSLDRLGLGLTRVGATGLAASAVLGAGLLSASRSAADLEQAVGGTEAVFKDASGAIDAFAEGAADKVGLSERAFRELSTTVGAQLKNMGFSIDEAAEKSIDLVEIGADLAATYGGTTAEAVQALGAALRGEADPAERFGLSLNQTAVNAKAVELGLAASTSQVSAQAKAQATLALITEQSADAQGQFAREADTAAGRQQRLTAAMEDLKASIGEGALPVLNTLTDVARVGVGAFQGLDTASGGLVGKLAAYGTVGLAASSGLSLVAGQAIRMRDSFSGAVETTRKLTTSMGGLGRAAAFVGGPTALVAAAIALDQYNKAQQQAGGSRLAAEFLAAGDSAEKMDEAIRGAGGGVRELVIGFNELVQSDRAAAERFVERLEEAGTSAEVLDRFRNILETTAAAERTAAADTEALSGAMGDQAGATEEATSALEEWRNAVAAAFDPLFGMIDAQNGLRDAQAATQEAQAALNEAIASGDPTAIAEAQRDYDDALTGSSQALVEAQTAQSVLNDAIATGDVSLADAQSTLYTWAINAGYTAEQAAVMAGQLGTATEAARTLDNQNVDVPLTATDNATAPMDLVKQKLIDLDGRQANVTVKVTATGQAALNLINQKLLGFASGGVVPGRVGSPQLVLAHGGETIVPTHDRAAMAEFMPQTFGVPAPFTGGGGGGGGGYSPTYIVNVNGGLASSSEIGTRVVEAIKGYERSNGSGWRK